MLVLYLAVGTTLSCEIEDDFGRPDLSESLGRKLFTVEYGVLDLFWMESTDEVIVAMTNEIVALGSQTNTVRRFNFSENPPGYVQPSQSGDKVLLFDYSGEVSVMDLATFGRTPTLADSAIISGLPTPFNSSYFAYAKYPKDMVESSIFLYNLASGKEVYVAMGYPIAFSPDGNQLLFLYGSAFYRYDIATKAITVEFSGYYGQLIRWTSDGVISFTYDYQSIVAKNETTGKKVGEWKSLEYPSPWTVSKTGRNIITTKSICGIKDVTGVCPGYEKIVHSIANIDDNTEESLVFSYNTYTMQKAFSPDEKNFAYVGNNNIYLTESEP